MGSAMILIPASSAFIRGHIPAIWPPIILVGRMNTGKTIKVGRTPSSTLTLDGVLEKFAELLRCEAGILNDGVVPRDSQDSPAVGNPSLCLSVFIRVHPWPLIPCLCQIPSPLRGIRGWRPVCGYLMPFTVAESKTKPFSHG
jgi:hypothetical protein